MIIPFPPHFNSTASSASDKDALSQAAQLLNALWLGPRTLPDPSQIQRVAARSGELPSLCAELDQLKALHGGENAFDCATSEPSSFDHVVYGEILP